MTTTTTTTLPLVAGRWAVDLAHSSVGFSVRHLGVSKVRGRFNRFDVDVVIGATLEDTSVNATIDVASIDTGNADRDAHVLSADIVDVARRPTIVFRSTRVSDAGDHYTVDGDLTIGEITKRGHARGRARRGSRSSPAARVTPASRRRRRSSGRTSTSTSRCRRA